MRKFGSFLLVLAIVAAWIYLELVDTREPFTIGSEKLTVADGDSFAIGPEKLRLDGIDAPEYRQTCKDAAGRDWECGKAARAALEQMLRQPGVSCITEARDSYARSIVTCSSTGTKDIGAAQVAKGMAVSNEYYEIRDYGDEEDAAREAKNGIWAGTFARPSEWRAAQPTLRTKTLPAE
jgi:endonuclease YncB( thermonuclease family)